MTEGEEDFTDAVKRAHANTDHEWQQPAFVSYSTASGRRGGLFREAEGG